MVKEDALLHHALVRQVMITKEHETCSKESIGCAGPGRLPNAVAVPAKRIQRCRAAGSGSVEVRSFAGCSG